MRFCLFIAFALLWALSAAAQTKVVSEAADATAVTIYPDNLALITEVRKVTVPAGRSVIAFEGVSDLIIPQSMVLREFTGVTLERNFDYDLLSKTALFENAIGETITLTRIDRASGKVRRQQAEIVSATVQTGVIVSIDGKYEALSCSGLAERESFDDVPSQLNPAPVMSVEVNAETEGEQELVISYLTSGLGWQADYRADLKPDDKASLLAWLTLTNRTAKNYADVPLAIVAGDLNRSHNTRGVSVPRRNLQAKCYPKGNTKKGVRVNLAAVQSGKVTGYDGGVYNSIAEMPASALQARGYASDEIVVTGARVATEEKLGDYKLYRIPDLVTVAPYQTKQIAFINEDDVMAEPYFEWETHVPTQPDLPTPLKAVYDIDNSYEGDLAKSLPKGTFRVFAKTDNGRALFVGEDNINNLAVDEPVEIKTGEAFNVHIQTRHEQEWIDPKTWRINIKHRISNAADEAVRVKIINYDERMRPLDRIKNESHPLEDAEAIPTWLINVPANSAEILSYDFQYKR